MVNLPRLIFSRNYTSYATLVVFLRFSNLHRGSSTTPPQRQRGSSATARYHAWRICLHRDSGEVSGNWMALGTNICSPKSRPITFVAVYLLFCKSSQINFTEPLCPRRNVRQPEMIRLLLDTESLSPKVGGFVNFVGRLTGTRCGLRALCH